MRNRVKITDLAEELGVSPSTISRALRGDERISKKTRDAVFELAERWGYNPNPFAVNLLKKRSMNIGLILPEFTHNYFSKALVGIDEVLTNNGYCLLINTHGGDYEKEVKGVQILNRMMVDGLLVSCARNTTDFSHYKDIIDNNIPMVFFDRLSEDLEVSYAITDDFPGATNAVDHLAKSGCKRIAHLEGPENLSTAFIRKTGYMEGLKQHSMEIDRSLILPWQENQEDYRNAIEHFINEQKPDGIFAYNDYVAYDVLIVAQKLSITVPSALSIIGFADEPISSYCHPKISTVAQPAEEMGKRAAEILLWHMANSGSPKLFNELLPTQLILRATTKPL